MIKNDIDKLTALVTTFRAAIVKNSLKSPSLVTLRDFPCGACGDAALLLSKYLEENGYSGFDYVLGQREGHSHAWLQKEGLIIDITADQFEDQKKSVIVTEDHMWHSLFRGKVEHAADFNIFDPHTVSELSRAYQKIKEQLET